MKAKLKSVAVFGAILSVFAAIATPAAAAPVTQHFEFSSSTGPLQFGPTIGFFTYDDSIVPVGGGFATGPGLFSQLSVQFGAFSFNATTANTGSLAFDAGGNLVGALFGNNCGAFGLCATVPIPLQFPVASRESQWLIGLNTIVPALNVFSYTGFGSNGFLPRITTSAGGLLPQQATVPEPSSLLLAGLALAGLAATRRRRTNPAHSA